MSGNLQVEKFCSHIFFLLCFFPFHRKCVPWVGKIKITECFSSFSASSDGIAHICSIREEISNRGPIHFMVANLPVSFQLYTLKLLTPKHDLNANVKVNESGSMKNKMVPIEISVLSM